MMTTAQEFVIEGQIDALTMQLRHKFGDLSESQMKRLKESPPDALLQYFMRVLSAKSVDEVLN